MSLGASGAQYFNVL